jgi:hypothetical protein
MISRHGEFAGGAVLAAALVVSGCTSIYRTGLMTGQAGSVATVTEDAKQRNVFMVPEVAFHKGNNVYTGPGVRMCAEPAPDALSALSIAASGELQDQLSSATPEIRLKAALAISEVAATIPRTQTINALRESMYRTCERYLNDAISKDEFIIQAARDQRTLVAILAIEQMTQAARPPQVMLTAGAANTATGGDTDYVKAVNDASDVQVAADADLKTKQDAYSKAADPKKCDDLLKTTDETKVQEADKTAWKACGLAKASMDGAAAANDKAKARLANIKQVAANAAGSAAASAAAGVAAVQALPSSNNDITAIAPNIQHIVDKAFDFDELQETCVVALRRGRGTENPLYDHCLPLVNQALDRATNRFGLSMSDYAAYENTLAKKSSALKAYLETPGKTPSAQWATLLDKTALAARGYDVSEWKKKTKPSEMILIFEQIIPPEFQDDMIQKAKGRCHDTIRSFCRLHALGSERGCNALSDRQACAGGDRTWNHQPRIPQGHIYRASRPSGLSCHKRHRQRAVRHHGFL